VIGYFIYSRKEPVLLSSVIKDITKNKSISLVVNAITVISTVIGVVAAVTLGVSQITGGLNHLFLVKNLELGTSILILLLISSASLFSALSGVNRGIKIISKFNIILTLSLLAFVFFQSDMLRIVQQFFVVFYHYIKDFIPMSLALGKYNPGKEFLTNWTYFYWAFWLAWAPFTGIFIARISKGRSIREFVFAILLIPPIGTFFWFTTFGESAFAIIENWGSYNNEFESVFTSIFLFFKEYPLQSVINALVILLLFTFLITSVDSAIFVLSMFTDKGKENPSLNHRIIWGIFIPLFGTSLLLLGNTLPEINVLSAISKLIIITSLPFTLITVIIMVIFIKTITNTSD
jgi:glycine betaine transporter